MKSYTVVVLLTSQLLAGMACGILGKEEMRWNSAHCVSNFLFHCKRQLRIGQGSRFVIQIL